ncbi:MAG: hypothetical protein PHZ11_01895, partial [Desulfitobacteriaceae bacterium]|nr:hypothetical protein [Desulfitobacteriaceae bacterium]
MFNCLLTRALIIALLWTGLILMKADGKMNTQLLWQAIIFSAVLIMGFLLERIFKYHGDQYLIPVVAASFGGATMSCFLCGTHRLRSSLTTRKF